MVPFSFIIVMLLFSATKGEGSTDPTWSCPSGWQPFTDQGPVQCLWTSPNTASKYSDAYDVCKAFDANLITIFSEQKFQAVHELMSQNASSWSYFWTGLKLFNETFMWQTLDGWEEMTFREDNFTMGNIDYYLRRNYHCGVMRADENGYGLTRCNYHQSLRFICEKLAECNTGWFGEQCEKQCHCNGQACESTSSTVTCPFGCQQGWMGDACDQKKEKASMTYHCVNSKDGNKRVSIFIDTKGVDYRAIQAVNEANTALPWCKSTEIKFASDSVTIQIVVNDTDVNEMDNACAGKAIAGNVYEWRISIKEWEGLSFPMDQIIQAQCDFFYQAESLVRTGGVVAAADNVSAQPTEVAKTMEKVDIRLVDAATKLAMVTSRTGKPVILQIQHTFEEDSVVKSIAPHDCVATSTDGKHSFGLLDSNGCQMDGSPVKPFVLTDEPGIVETPWFPFFYLDGNPGVVFRCSFVLCYDKDCPVGCQHDDLWLSNIRHVRSTRREVRGQVQLRVDLAK